MNREMPPLPWYAWVGIAALLLGQGTWLFLDARRRGARAWLWGLLGLIQFPVPLLLYWLLVIRRQAMKP
jgi:hypothetical protein